MNRYYKLAAIVVAVIVGGASASQAAVILTSASTSVAPGNYTLNPNRGEIGTVSSSQQGGAWFDTETNSVAAVASGTTSAPFFELTITNQTGVTLTSMSLTGSRIQFKDNSSNLNETLTATIAGISGQTVSGLNIAAVSNNGDASSTVNTPPLTASYSASISNFSLAHGASFTIRWTDANDGGTDALFGLQNLTVNTVVPEPASLGLIGLAGLPLLGRRCRCA